jgi:hypothetical protein
MTVLCGVGEQETTVAMVTEMAPMQPVRKLARRAYQVSLKLLVVVGGTINARCY